MLCIFGAVMGTWTDEEYTLATTAHGAVYAWHRAIDYELQAPLYFAIVAAWRLLDFSVWFARLFSILSAVALYGTLLQIGRRIAPARDPLPFAILVALNPFVVYAALEIRVYAFGLLLSALAWLTFDDGFVRGNARPSRIAFVAIAAAALYVQYFIGFLILGLFASLFVVRGRRALTPTLAAGGAIAILIVPLLMIIRSQIGGSGTTSGALSELTRSTIERPLLDFSLPIDESWHVMYLNGFHDLVALALIVLVTLIRPRLNRSAIASLVALAVVDTCYVSVVLVFRLELVARHFIALFVAIVCAGYAVIDATLVRRRIVGVACTVVYTAFLSVTLSSEYHAFAKTGDVKRIDAALERRIEPGDRVAVFPADALPSYARYYVGSTPFLPFPRSIPEARYEIGSIEVSSEREAAEALRRMESGHRLWFVMQGSCRDRWSFYFGCDHVLAALHRAGAVEDPGYFYDGRLFIVPADGILRKTDDREHGFVPG